MHVATTCCGFNYFCALKECIQYLTKEFQDERILNYFPETSYLYVKLYYLVLEKSIQSF